MIIINGEEQQYTPKYSKSDNTIVTFNADHGINPTELLEAIKNNQPLPDGVTMHTYVRHDEEPQISLREAEEYTGNTLYLDDDDLVDMEDDFYSRPQIESDFERYNLHYPGAENLFDEVPLPQQMVYDQLADSMGILTSVMREDIPAREMLGLSRDGADLMWHFNDTEGRINSSNPIPDIDTIRYYSSLSPYEKRIIRSTHYHPRTMLDVKQEIDRERHGMILPESAVRLLTNELRFGDDSYAQSVQKVSGSVLHPYLTDDPHYPEGLQKAREAFQNEFHFVPRVIDEYFSAQCTVVDHVLNNDEINDMVHNFSRQSLSKVARYHSQALYALAPRLNFNEISDEHIQVFGVCMNAESVKTAESSGFLNWYNANKSRLSASELIPIIEDLNNPNYSRYLTGNFFDPSKSSDEILFNMSQLRGRNEKGKMERKYGEYGYKWSDNDLAIRGRNIQVTDGKYTIMMLPADDYRNFTVGYDTHCCQHYGNAGESCVWELTSDPCAGITCIVDNKDIKDGKWLTGNCLAQAFTWTDESKDTIVFDNMEFANDRQVQNFSDLIAAWAQAMPYKNMHVGCGYNQAMNGWGTNVTQDMMATMPKNARGTCHRSIYSDYHISSYSSTNDAKAIKKDGQLRLAIKQPENIHVTERPLQPSRYEALLDPRVSWVLSGSGSLAEKMQLAEEFLHSSSEEQTQLHAINANPDAIKYIDHPTEAVQKVIAENHKDLIPFIHNPSPVIYGSLVKNNPYAILKISEPNKELWKIALENNGLLLEKCPIADEELKQVAVSQNGLAVKYVSRPTQEVQDLAVHQNPVAVGFIQAPSEAAIGYAVSQDPTLMKNLDSISQEMQMNMVTSGHPEYVLYMKQPAPEVVAKAISLDGRLIKNFRGREDLEKLAVKSDGLAIRYIRNPSQDVCVEAYKQNPRALRYMRVTPAIKQAIVDTVRQESRTHDQTIERG